MRVIYCGLSGVGKDYLARKNAPLLDRLSIEHVSFADLMLEASRKHSPEMDRDMLRALDSKKRRYLVDCAHEMIIGANANVLVNTHMVVEGIPLDEQTDELAEKLQPSGVICVTANPVDILLRRDNDQSRQRPCATEEQIERLQDFQRDMLCAFGGRLGIAVEYIDTSQGVAGDENVMFEKSLMNMRD